MSWQPIETAPKDGTLIFAIMAGCHPHTGDPFVPCVVFWDEVVGWMANETEREEYEPHDWHLTHWWSFDGKHMPEPPK